MTVLEEHISPCNSYAPCLFPSVLWTEENSAERYFHHLKCFFFSYLGASSSFCEKFLGLDLFNIDNGDIDSFQPRKYSENDFEITDKFVVTVPKSLPHFIIVPIQELEIIIFFQHNLKSFMGAVSSLSCS